MMLHFLDDLRADVGYAARWLRRSPGFAVTTILSLALGIGANASIFNLINVVLLRDLPVLDPDRLVVVFTRNAGGEPARTLSFRLFQTLRRETRTLSDLFASAPLKMNVDTNPPTPTATGQMVSGNYFVALGVAAAIGRTIGPED